MKTKSFPLLISLACAAILSGCSTNYTPNPRVPKLREIPDVAAGTRVSIVNAQPSADKVNISQSGITINVYADYHAWTEQLVESLGRTLKKKGALVGESNPKTLKVAVTKATLSLAGGGWTTRTTIVCTVQIGDSEPITLGNDDTGLNWKNGIEGALEKLVTTVLSDDRVQKYLTSP